MLLTFSFTRKKECAHYIRSRGVRMYVCMFVCAYMSWCSMQYSLALLSLNSFNNEDVSIDNDGNGSEEICYYYCYKFFLTEDEAHFFFVCFYDPIFITEWLICKTPKKRSHSSKNIIDELIFPASILCISLIHRYYIYICTSRFWKHNTKA